MNNGFQNQNQGFHQNRGNYNQGPNQGNFQGNYGNFQNANHGNYNHGNQNFQNQGFNNNNRGQNFQNPIVNQNQSSLNKLLKQFMKSQEEMNKMLINQMAELKKSLNDRPSGSGTLPSNTIANPRGDAKAITTRSGITIDGPTAPTTSSSSSPKVVARETEVTMDTEIPINNGRTENIQPPAVPTFKGKDKVDHEIEKEIPVKTKLPYPSRLNEQKHREGDKNKMEKFYQIF